MRPDLGLFDDDLTGRSPKTLVDAPADRNQAFFAHEVAGWTGGRRSVNEVGIELLHTGSCPSGGRRWPSPAPRSLGWSPLEVTDDLLGEFRLADRHRRGVMVEQVMALLAMS